MKKANMTWTRLPILRKKHQLCVVWYFVIKKNTHTNLALLLEYYSLEYLFIAMLSNGLEIEMLKNVLLNKGLTPSF